jgi:amidase
MAGWVGRPATEIAAAVRSGEVTAAQVVAGHLDRIAKINAELGAFVRIRPVEAAREATEVDARPDRADLPLAGVPVAIKDAIPVAGEPMRLGSLAAPVSAQAEDHPLVARLREAGAVVVGLTNLPELSIYPFTDSAFGIARNPWDRRRTPGGSSGGSAAAVASAMVPIAHGTDGLGSVRIPAAACGLFGLKPGPGVVPAQVGADSWGGLLENGPLATTVADAALMLGVMAAARFDLDEPPPLRIAASVRAPGPGVVVHRSYTAAVRQCAGLLGSLGHTVETDDPAYPPWATPMLIASWLASPAADVAPYRSGLERRTRWHVRAGQLVQRVRPPREADRDRLRAALLPFFDRHDVLVMPSLAWRCPSARRWGERSWPRSVIAALRFAPMTGVWNMAGFPAASVPCPPASGLPASGRLAATPGLPASGRLAATPGLPASVQLVAAPGGEALLLALAAQLERARPWPRHAPAYS